MGTVYKPWNLRLRALPVNVGFIPHTNPPVKYKIFWTPDNVGDLNRVSPGYSPFTDGPAGALSGDSPFQKANFVTRLPKCVIVVNALFRDQFWNPNLAGFPLNTQEPTFPAFSDLSLNHFTGLGATLYAVLKPLGIMVYQSNCGVPNNLNEWIYRSMPVVSGNEAILGGDVYFIFLINNYYFLGNEQFYNAYDRHYNPDSSYTDTFYASVAPLIFPAEDVNTIPSFSYHVTPIAAWSSLVGSFRNWHGLACAVPRQGDSTSIVRGGIFGDAQIVPNFGLPLLGTNHVWTSQYDLTTANATIQTWLSNSVNTLNGASPNVPGDATWEYASVGTTQDFGYFVDKVRSWFGV